MVYFLKVKFDSGYQSCIFTCKGGVNTLYKIVTDIVDEMRRNNPGSSIYVDEFKAIETSGWDCLECMDEGCDACLDNDYIE